MQSMATSDAPARPAPLAPVAFPHTLTVRFTGSGSEYFRIWIVNLLLTVLTLTLYLPWAKVRRLKYFHGNTLVGDAPLGFHGNPRQMLRGYLLVGLLFVLYSVAGQFSPVAGAIALLIVTVISPALWRASLQFRLANTSWHGLRFRFTGDLRGAYAPTWPAVALLVGGFGLGMLSAVGPPQLSPSGLAALAVATLLLMAWAAVWMIWRTKKYQHGHYALGNLQTAFSARVGQFAGLALRCAGVAALVNAVVGGLVAVAVLAGGFQGLAAQRIQVITTVGVLGAMFLLFVALKPYLVTRMQNLVWNHTGSGDLQFHSALRFRSMLALSLKNWLLIVVTLGLYWPFAAVAMARLRLDAMALTTRDDPESLVAALNPAHRDAVGDAAGDLFGLDVGL